MENPTQPTSEATPATHNPNEKQTAALALALDICRKGDAHALTPDEVDEVAYQLGRFLRRTLGCFAPVITPNDIRNSGNEGAETLTDEEAQDVCMIMDDNESTASTVNEAVAELVYQAIEDRKGDATK
jgi:hypothetical protein